jgi:DNA polymerase I
MRPLILDIESDGLLDNVTRAWCFGIQVDAYEEFNDEQNGKRPIAAALETLQNTPRNIVGHNLIGYDLPLMEKLYGVVIPIEKVRDTQVMGRLLNPCRRRGHSLSEYGEAMGVPKGDHDDWTRYSEEMAIYLQQDVLITSKLYEELDHRLKGWGMSVDLEHRFARCIGMVMKNGFTLNVRMALEVAAEAQDEMRQLEAELQAAFPPRFVADGKVFTPKRDTAIYCAGAPSTKIKLEVFNPGSGMQIASRLIAKYNWQPAKFTDSGEPATDQHALEELDYPEAKLLARFARVEKIWSQIAKAPSEKRPGSGGWVHHVKNGRVHGYINHNGAVSSRCTHSKPNMGNIDKKDTRLREVWEACEGWVLVGADAEGLELRMLAHYLARFDGGAYARAVVEGKKEDETDNHSLTRKLVGLFSRDNAKRVMYALLYGAGDAKLGAIIVEDIIAAGKPMPKGANGKFLSKSALGKAARAKLIGGLTGLSDLINALKASVKRGYLIGLDGRHIEIRSDHSALNTLLQGAGAVLMKLATVLYVEEMERRFGPHGGRWGLCAHVHDEVQTECEPAIAEEAGKLFSESLKKAGEILKVRCPLSGSFDIGPNWKATH